MGDMGNTPHVSGKNRPAPFRLLLEAAPDAVVIIDAVGRIRLTNARAEKMFGYCRHELVGQPHEVLLPLCPAVQRMVSGNGNQRWRPGPWAQDEDLVAVRKDGSEFFAEVALVPAESDSGLLISLIVRDATERIRLLDAARRSYVSEISHELKSPLTAIIGYAELLSERTELSDESRTYLDILIRCAHRGVDLTKDLLAGNVPDPRRPREAAAGRHNLATLVRESVERVQLYAAQNEVLIDVHLPQQELWASGSTVRLGQVIDNLINNAVKFSPATGRVTVNAGVVEEAGEDRICLEVRDEGSGISAEALPHIFDQFFRAPEAIESGLPGSGLGLAISRRIVRQHGGTIDVASVLGQGSTFRVRLPSADASRRGARSNRMPSPRGVPLMSHSGLPA